MKRLTWIIVVLLAMPLSATAGLFGLEGSKSDVAAKVATLDEDGLILGLDFSPDGKHLAATPFDSATVHIWGWQANRLERTLERAQGSNVTVTEPIRYSPDGKLLAICHTRGAGFVVARIWNTDTWNVVHDIDEPVGGECDAIGFTPDGKSLIQALLRLPQFSGDTLISYDTTSWNASWGIRTVPFYPGTLAISPDGKYVAIGGEVINPNSWPFSTPQPTFGNPPIPNMGLIAIVNIAQHAIIRTIKIKNGDPGGVLAWSADSIHLAYEGKDGLEIFDAHSGERVVEETKESDRSSVHMRYTPDGKYFIESDFGQDGTRVRIWDGQHQQLLQEIKAIPGCIAISRDGHYLAMGGSAPSITNISPLLSLMLPSRGKIVVYELK